MSCEYTSTIKAEFGRKISAKDANEQFIAIETAMACLEAMSDQAESTNNNIYNYGSVKTEKVLTPSFGNMQLITVEGPVELSYTEPEATDPRLIYLLIADGGSGTFSFPDGLIWTTNSNGTSVDGKPWDSNGLGGDYGAVVICLHDKIGWLYLCFARNSIDFTAAVDVNDLYGWR